MHTLGVVRKVNDSYYNNIIMLTLSFCWIHSNSTASLELE